ncbi:hypothetical protein [Amycolatopsis speibonae]|uniref:Uncharacterized protein n=1 Tax=Amycolatopsis speibonae TaxID=1450224 RepID=A0ABV7P3T8_9PSEU
MFSGTIPLVATAVFAASPLHTLVTAVELSFPRLCRHQSEQLRATLGGPRIPLAPTRIDNDLFAGLYSLGQRH